MSYYRSTISMKPSKIEFDMEDDGCLVMRFYKQNRRGPIHEVYLHIDESSYEFFSGLDAGDKYTILEERKD